jgi:hypothetical protein
VDLSSSPTARFPRREHCGTALLACDPLVRGKEKASNGCLSYRSAMADLITLAACACLFSFNFGLSFGVLHSLLISAHAGAPSGVDMSNAVIRFQLLCISVPRPHSIVKPRLLAVRSALETVGKQEHLSLSSYL